MRCLGNNQMVHLYDVWLKAFPDGTESCQGANMSAVSPASYLRGQVLCIEIFNIPWTPKTAPGRVPFIHPWPQSPKGVCLGATARGQTGLMASILQVPTSPHFPPSWPHHHQHCIVRGQTSPSHSRAFCRAPSARQQSDYTLQRPACSIQTERIHSLTPRPIKK